MPRRPRRISPVQLVWICGIALGLLAGGVVAYGVISVGACNGALGQPDLAQALAQIGVGGDRRQRRGSPGRSSRQRRDQIVGPEVQEERRRIARMGARARATG